MKRLLSVVLLVAIAVLGSGCLAKSLATPTPMTEPIATAAPAAPEPTRAVEPTATAAGGTKPTRAPLPAATATAEPEPTRAAEPTAAVVEEPEPTRTTEPAAMGEIVYNYPPELTEGQAAHIQVLLIATADPTKIEETKEEITAPGTPMAEPLRVTRLMEVDLKYDQRDFQAQPQHNSARQLVSESQPTDWSWLVTPLRPGSRTLYVRATQIEEIMVNGRAVETRRDVPEKVITLSVRVNPPYSVSRLIRSYWWVSLGVLGLVAGAFLVLKRRRNKAQPQGGSDQTHITGRTDAPLWSEEVAAQEQRMRLRHGLVEHFDLSEFRVLCADLNINYDVLDGEGLDDKAVDLVDYMDRRGRIAELVAACRKNRPNAAW